MNSVLASVIATVGTRLSLVQEVVESPPGDPELLALVEEARQEWDAARGPDYGFGRTAPFCL